jgi:hypothetical protein
MTRIVKEAIFFIAAAAILIPAPTLLYAWMTYKTLAQVMYR